MIMRIKKSFYDIAIFISFLLFLGSLEAITAFLIVVLTCAMPGSAIIYKYNCFIVG